jgi:hypothetical protein
MQAATKSSITLALALGAALGVGCRYDPIPEEKLDKLPPEDPEGPSELHRAGQPCVDCHSEYEGADPLLAIGGTVYEQNPSTFQLIPVEGVFVTLFDAAGASQKACTNAAGNFYVTREDWPDAAFPLTVQVGNRFMRSLIGRDRSCATCHKLASVGRIEQDPTIDTSTGAGRDSAGAILVERDTIPIEEQCGINPAAASAASSGAGGGGGAGGAGGASNGSGGAGGNQ